MSFPISALGIQGRHLTTKDTKVHEETHRNIGFFVEL